MGIADFFKNKSKNKITGVSTRKLKQVEGFDAAWLEQPQFKDLMACLVQIGKTDVDVTRITSRRYLKRLAYGTATVDNKQVKQIFEATGVEREMLDVDGYINQAMHKLRDAALMANKRREVRVDRPGGGHAQRLRACLRPLHPRAPPRLRRGPPRGGSRSFGDRRLRPFSPEVTPADKCIR